MKNSFISHILPRPASATSMQRIETLHREPAGSTPGRQSRNSPANVAPSRFLVTGIRVPNAFDVVRNLARHGHYVVGADSIRYPVGRSSSAVREFHQYSSPSDRWSKFRTDVLRLVEAEAIDFVLPTCEEVAYLAVLKPELEAYCRVLCPGADLIRDMYSKAGIQMLADDCKIGLPRTESVDADELRARAGDLRGLVVKPEFCSGGATVLLDPTPQDVLALIDQTPGTERYVIQQRVSGTEYSCYAIACEGQLRAQVTYEPVHRFRSGPCFYFRPVWHEKLVRFIEAFVSKYRFTGQLAFDLIDDGDVPYLIECNPRTTSGVHLVAPRVDIAACLLESGPLTVVTDGDAMIRGAMIAFGLPNALRHRDVRRWWRDFRGARDVISVPGDRQPPGYQFLSGAEFAARAVRNRSSLGQEATSDILWKGERLD